ncbi:gephyrin-like molybdotransferase Glp [Chitinimonas sp. BJYL2]|uniref:molybdopterin molybdotransferase MoeA n=1 Tax=Chitinimonas sp. BJYL2 TaxID=2976696 RepID=UPI0022B2C877|nr:gephyrin-like molybdotransferase Glp [Chitinimonas sp. BJYL2]
MSLLSFDDALTQLLNRAHSVTGETSVALSHCDGRVLAHDVIAPLAVPGFDNSAMDGYALNLRDPAQPPASLPVVQRIAAGQTGTALAPDTAARIFTGAPVPPGCNVVVPQEETATEGDTVQLLAPVRLHQHIRRRGEDIAEGSVVLKAGTRLGPAQLALSASLGIATLPVRPALRVGLLCTGDELTEPGQPLPEGGIYNSNRYAIGTLLRRLGVQLHDYGTVADRADATRAALGRAADECDVVISCGGVSVGAEDHVKAAVLALGELDLWRIAIKPGKPLAFGRVGKADFIGLPGNPVSAFLTFLLLARPFLLARMGAAASPVQALPVRAAFTRAKAESRREFLRAQLAMNADGTTEAVLYRDQGSAVMSGLAWADGLIDVLPGQTVAPGDLVRFLPLPALLD